ncbi:MAG TPA: hypothetical protein VKG38_07325 [Solirubrobacteraceae bacterium]|nr:hypothetical protein [Solirubrobacteraceae bacterium]
MIPTWSQVKSPALPRGSFPALAGVLAGLTLAALSGILPLASAQAATAATCPGAALSEPFAAWGDTNSYSLVPGGNFEGSLTGWTLSAGAKTVAGGEPNAASGNLGLDAVQLPAGASVQSPPVCVSSSEHTFRFFVRSEGKEAKVNAQIIYGSVNGSDPGQKTTATGTWAPSTIFHTGPLVAKALETSATVEVALRITSLSGTARIDDLFQDPRMR